MPVMRRDGDQGRWMVPPQCRPVAAVILLLLSLLWGKGYWLNPLGKSVFPKVRAVPSATPRPTKVSLCGWADGQGGQAMAAPAVGVESLPPYHATETVSSTGTSPSFAGDAPYVFQPAVCSSGDCAELCASRPVVSGVDSHTCVRCGEPTWSMRGPIPWEVFAQGEYVGPHRCPHVPEYRLRPEDELELVFRLTRQRSAKLYELEVGDQILIESIADSELKRTLEVQPDGSITLPLVGQVLAAGLTTDQIRLELDRRFQQFYKDPAITVTPTKVNTRLFDLRDTVDRRQGLGGQFLLVRVAPDGTISVPALGRVPAQGLSLTELKRELDARYNAMFDGVEIVPILSRRAPRFIYVVGQVTQPGRFELTGPTTVIGALALAQGPTVGSNLRQIVIFRRASDWRLLATKVDIRGAMYGCRPAPSDELWLRDSDIVIVPKAPIKTVTDGISLVFTQGVYAVAPFLNNLFFAQAFSTESTF